MGCNIIQPGMVPEVVGWCVVVSAFEDPVTFADMIGKEHPVLCVNIAHQFLLPSAGRACHFDARTGVVKPVSVIISHCKANFGWVRCRVYIGPLHPTNFFNSKNPEGSGTDCPSSCPSASLLLLSSERKGKFNIHHYLAPDLTDCGIDSTALLDA